MLRSFRRAAKTKFASVIIGALVVAFALWGVSDIFRGTVANTVASVGGTDISAADYDRELRARIRQIAQLTPNFTLAEARAVGLDQQVLDDVISRTALDLAAAGLGLTASDEAVSNLIQTSGQFGSPFNYQLFLQALQENGLTEAGYVELTRRDIVRAQMLNAVTGAMKPAPGLTKLLYDYFNETRVVEYVRLTPEDAGEIADPTEEELTQFHTAHPELFSAPEYRSIEYVVIGPAQVAGQIEITEEDLLAAYERDRALFDTPERRTVQQITFPNQQEAEAAAARIAAGTDLAAIAQERGLSEQDINIGTVAADGLAPELAAAVFAAPSGGVTAPVQGPFGWVIARISEILPGITRTFDDMRETLRAGVITDRGRGQAVDLSNAFEDARAGGSTLAEAAASQSLEVRRVEAVDREARTPDGTMADISDDPSLLDEAFATESGEESLLFQGEDENYYAVRVNAVTPSALRPLEEVRAEVREGWLAQARASALEAMASNMAVEAQSGGLARAAAGFRRAPVRSMPLRRDSIGDAFSPALLQQVFSVPRDIVVAGLAASGNDYVVARVVEIDHPVPDVASAEYAAFERERADEMGNDAVQALAAAARESAGVTTYPQVLQMLFGETLP